jgi:two-component system response regulator FixJ
METASPLIFVIDDDPDARDSLSLLLDTLGFDTRSYESALAFLRAENLSQLITSRLCCLLLDIRMPDMGGLELQDELRARQLDLPIIFVSAQASVRSAVRALKGGAVDLLEKPYDDQELLDTLNWALRERSKELERHESFKGLEETLATLSERENDVLDLIIDGLPNKRIASQLDISVRTVENHRSHILHKMGKESVSELVRSVSEYRATRAGWARSAGIPHSE